MNLRLGEGSGAGAALALVKWLALYITKWLPSLKRL